jgi:hypothetical protein
MDIQQKPLALNNHEINHVRVRPPGSFTHAIFKSSCCVLQSIFLIPSKMIPGLIDQAQLMEAQWDICRYWTYFNSMKQ